MGTTLAHRAAPCGGLGRTPPTAVAAPAQWGGMDEAQIIRNLEATGADEREIEVQTLRIAARVCRGKATVQPDADFGSLAAWFDAVADRVEGPDAPKADEGVALVSARGILGVPFPLGQRDPDLTARILTDDDLAALSLLLDNSDSDAEHDRNLLMGVGEVHVAAALLAHYGRGEDGAARLARRWSAKMAKWVTQQE